MERHLCLILLCILIGNAESKIGRLIIRSNGETEQSMAINECKCGKDEEMSFSVRLFCTFLENF